MSRKFSFASIAGMLAAICISSCANGHSANTEYRQFPAAKFLFADPSAIFSINWSVPDRLIIESVYIHDDGKSHPVDVGNLSSGEISPLTIRGETIYGSRPTISPDGQYLALYADNGIIRIIPVEEAVTNEIQLSGHTASSLAWSHDSNYLAFTDGGEIYIYDLQKDQVEMKFDPALPDLMTPLCCSLAWSADDQKIAVALKQGKKDSMDDQSDIYVLNLKNDQFIQVTNTPDMDEEFPVWFPKEDILLFVSGTRTGIWGEYDERLVLVRGDGLCQMEISKTHGISSPVWSPDGTKLAFADLDKVYYVDASALEDQFNLFREKCNIAR
jgi:Tol biopolymer transport system component